MNASRTTTFRGYPLVVSLVIIALLVGACGAAAAEQPITKTDAQATVNAQFNSSVQNAVAATAAAESPTAPTTNGEWTVQYFAGATDQMHQWGTDLKPLTTDWAKFPNVDFAKYDFKAKDGLEYGMAESAYCQQDQTCDVNTAAMHYRLITGDYNIPGVDSCTSKNGQGCAITLVNVGNVTAMWRNSHVDYGFTVTGRYWNGDAMATTISALGSNTMYNMLNGEGAVNAGANCSIPAGCKSVRFAWIVTSGNQMVMKSTTVVTR